jgi:hypothetical protein
MVTTVGTGATYPKLLQNLRLLEHDAIAAYDQTIERVDNVAWKEQIARFRADHARNIQELTELAHAVGVDALMEGRRQAAVDNWQSCVGRYHGRHRHAPRHEVQRGGHGVGLQTC